MNGKKIVSLILAAGLVSTLGIGGCAAKCTRDFVLEKTEKVVTFQQNNDQNSKTLVKNKCEIL